MERLRKQWNQLKLDRQKRQHCVLEGPRIAAGCETQGRQQVANETIAQGAGASRLRSSHIMQVGLLSISVDFIR